MESIEAEGFLSKQEGAGDDQLLQKEQGAEKQDQRKKLKRVLEWFRKYRREVAFTAGLITSFGGLGSMAITGENQREQEIHEIEEKLKRIGIRNDRLKEFFGDHTPSFAASSLDSTGAQTVETKATYATELNVLEGERGSISPEALREILETYPRGWVNDEVASITHEAQERDLDSQDGLEEGWTTLATCTGGKGEEKADIAFYKIQYPLSRDELLLDVLPHELAHANDWVNDSSVGIKQRVDLLTALAGRINAEDRFQSSYVESIHNDNVQLERYLKTQEYWAEIAATYFSSPGSLHIKDFRIVDRYVRAKDQGYNAAEAANTRTKVMIQNNLFG